MTSETLDHQSVTVTFEDDERLRGQKDAFEGRENRHG